MPSNSWQVGVPYPMPPTVGALGGLNKLWRQPGGPGTLVYPQQQVGSNYFSTQPFSELSGIFSGPCGHSFDQPLVQREYDYGTQSSVALICCMLCGYVIYTLEPFESALNTVEQPWLVA